MKKTIENIGGIVLPLLNNKSESKQTIIETNQNLFEAQYSFNQTNLIRKFVFFGFLLPLVASGQLRGRVISERNNGIPYASVAITNEQKFPFVLVVTSVGFRPNELVVKNSSVTDVIILLEALFQRDTVVITSRRRREVLQDVPIPISVIGGAQIDEAGAFNVSRVKEIVPSVQMYTSNPRNTGVNIRGIGSPFGLTNDGLDPGVGFYIDGVYIARPAFATLDFIDVEQIEVLR